MGCAPVKIFRTLSGSLAFSLGRYQLTLFPILAVLFGDLRLVQADRLGYARAFIRDNGWRVFLPVDVSRAP
jgi:hypothetical protein